MKGFYKPALLFCIITVLFVSCASVRFVQKEEDVRAVAALINKGDTDTLSSLSSVPFLFDREILAMNADPEILWNNLASAGFSLPGVSVLSIDQVNEESYSLFGDTMEVKVFFAKYVPPSARVAVVGSVGSTAVFILNDKVEGYPMILGFRVD